MSAVHVREELVPLLKDVAARSADFEQQRHISDDIIARFKQIGVYRALVPKSLGARSAPRHSSASLSSRSRPPMAPQAGWPAFGMSPFTSARCRRTPESTLPRRPGRGLCWRYLPAAESGAGRRRLSRQWAAWGLRQRQHGSLGIWRRHLPESGEPLPRMAVLPRDSVQIDPVWNTVGLAGTGQPRSGGQRCVCAAGVGPSYSGGVP